MKRIGVAGAGLIGKRHIEAIKHVPNAELSGVLDPGLQDVGDLPMQNDLGALSDCSDGIFLLCLMRCMRRWR